MRNRKRRRWFPKRPSINRMVRPRHQRMELHQLDVKLTSKRGRRVRQTRQRALVIKVAAVLLTLLTVSAAVRWAYRHAFYENSEFRLNRFVVVTDGVLTEADVAGASRVELGMNLMNIDLGEVRERVESLPMVTEVEVNRELPDLLEISVKEKVPLAWLSSPPHGVVPRSTANGFLIDEKGEVFRCQKLMKRFLDLPVIATHHTIKPTEGSKLDTAMVKEAIGLLKDCHRLFGSDGLEAKEIQIKTSYSLVVRFNNHMEVTFPIKDLERALQDLRLIITHSHSAGRQLATVNLVPKKNIPVTFYTPSQAPQRAVPVGRALPKVGGLPVVKPVKLASEEDPMERQLRSILAGD